MCDEAQFYTPAQVEQLARVVDELGADVHALGLLTDFRGRLFEGSARFLELADERHELQVEARCWCGARATQNARLVDGRQVYDGEVIVVGDTGRRRRGRPTSCSAAATGCAGETGRAEPDVAALDTERSPRPMPSRRARTSPWAHHCCTTAPAGRGDDALHRPRDQP